MFTVEMFLTALIFTCSAVVFFMGLQYLVSGITYQHPNPSANPVSMIAVRIVFSIFLIGTGMGMFWESNHWNNDPRWMLPLLLALLIARAIEKASPAKMENTWTPRPIQR